MWNSLSQAGFQYVFTRRLNQNALEVFFDEIRIVNGNALNPTSCQFIISFKKLFFMNYTNIGTRNCMADCDNILMSFDTFHNNVSTIDFVNDSQHDDFLHKTCFNNID